MRLCGSIGAWDIASAVCGYVRYGWTAIALKLEPSCVEGLITRGVCLDLGNSFPVFCQGVPANKDITVTRGRFKCEGILYGITVGISCIVGSFTVQNVSNRISDKCPLCVEIKVSVWAFFYCGVSGYCESLVWKPTVKAVAYLRYVLNSKGFGFYVIAFGICIRYTVYVVICNSVILKSPLCVNRYITRTAKLDT